MARAATLRRTESSERIRGITRVLWIVLFLNIIVAVAKYAYGTATSTSSMQADGIHSLFDSAGNIVGLIGMFIASRPADYGHPYGHGKFETFASAIIGVLLILAAWNVGSTAIGHLINGTASPDVTVVSFLVMIGTLAINLCVTYYEHRAAKRLKSEVLGADAHHTLSDVLVTIGVIIGLVFIKLGFTIADPIMSLIVAGAILYTAYTVFKQANATLSDSARIPVIDVARCATSVEGVRGCHEVRTRGTESEVYVDLHILVDPQMTVAHAHELADQVESKLHQEYPQVVDAVVHIEPDDEHQQEVSAAEDLTAADIAAAS